MEPQNLDSLTAIEDLPTLLHVTNDVEAAAQLRDHVTKLSVKGAGPALALVHPVVGTLTSLVQLDMSGSTVHYLPYFLSNLVSLQSLSFSQCELNFIPMEVGSLTALTSMDLSRNQLGSLPDALCKLTSLRTLNVMANQLTALPKDFGDLTNLRLLGLKSNRLTALPDSFTRLQSLVELFVTDNQLTTFPQGFGALTSLVKLQASFNPLQHLPDDLLALPKLELMRVAVGHLGSLPAALTAPESKVGQSGAISVVADSSTQHTAAPATPEAQAGVFPSLAWFSLGGNPACAPLPKARDNLVSYRMSDLEHGGTGDKLGEGASGEVRTAVLVATGEQVAVKIFRADKSPDGRTEEEVGIACAIDHPNLTHVIGTIPSSDLALPSPDTPAPAPASAPPLLVMRLVHGRPLAAKPTSEHILRCKWPCELRFSVSQCVTMTSGVAAALEYLHAMHICHGDVYAHNIMVDTDTWHSTLCDFGASFVYTPGQWFWEAMEVRGFGLYLKDVVERLLGDVPTAALSTLESLVTQCTRAPAAARPTFTQVKNTLLSISV